MGLKENLGNCKQMLRFVIQAGEMFGVIKRDGKKVIRVKS